MFNTIILKGFPVNLLVHKSSPSYAYPGMMHPSDLRLAFKSLHVAVFSFILPFSLLFSVPNNPAPLFTFHRCCHCLSLSCVCVIIGRK